MPLSTVRLREHLEQLYPRYRVVTIAPLAPDAGAAEDSTAKAAGYGRPIKVELAGPEGALVRLVWRVATADEFGHDRRADRAAETLLAFDDFARIPSHVRPLDVGAITRAGELISIRDYDELYLMTGYAPGRIYADDLRRIARHGLAGGDIERVDTLASYLGELHEPIADPVGYRRAVRDLIGHGEGIFGVIDGYPDDTPDASRERLHAIERRCVDWRWRLREHEGRLCRTHGDFHPFNVVFDDATLTVLDASRGTCGDPADDVIAMAINFILFALDAPDAWSSLGPLWHRFWASYRRRRVDPSLTAVAPPFFAWRALVVCNPRFYPGLSRSARDALLGFAEATLDACHLEPAWADELFR